MIERILVPLDGSRVCEAAVPHAAAIASAFDSEVHLVRAVQPGRAGGMRHDSVEWRMDRADASYYLERTAKELAEEGHAVRHQVLEGAPAEAVVDYARQNRVELIVLTTHGQGGPSEFLMGGTAHKIVQRAGISLLLVRAGEEAPPPKDAEYRRVVVPVDGSARGDWALCLAASVARRHGARLAVVHVVPVPEFVQRPPVDAEVEELRRRVTEMNRRSAEEYLENLRGRFEAPDLELETRIGASDQVGLELGRLIGECGADLVVAAAHGVSGVAPWPFGSVVTNLILYGDVPLLVLQDQPATLEEPVAATREYTSRRYRPGRMVDRDTVEMGVGPGEDRFGEGGH